MSGKALHANVDAVAWRIVDGEAVIVHAESSAYYGLNQSATHVWKLLVDSPHTADVLAAHVAHYFGEKVTDVRDDIDAFLTSLRLEGLLLDAEGASVVNAPSSSDARGGEPSSYAAPTLARFGELEQLVLSGE